MWPFRTRYFAQLWIGWPLSRLPLSALVLGCILVVSLGSLVGCGGPGSSSSSGGKTIITEMDYWNSAPTNDVVNQLFKAYQQSHPGVVIQRNAVPFGSLLSKADQQAASHTLPNLLMLDNPDVANFASTTYAFSVGNNDLALFYNKKMFADAHLSPPSTWGELADDAKKLTQGNTYGFAFSATATEEATWQFEPFLWSNGGDLTQVNSPQGIAALQFMTNLVHQGYASRAVLNWGQGDVTTQFQEGHAAMMENGPWNLPTLNQAHIDYGVGKPSGI